MKKILFAVITLSFFTVSCHKEKITGPDNAGGVTKKMKRIDEVTSTGSTGSELYQYDEKGRLKEWTYNTSRNVFDYSVNGKIMVTNFNNGVPEWKYECDLNSKGLVTGLLVKYPDGTLYGTYTYNYNSDDYLVYTSYTPVSGQGFSFTYQIENDNLVAYTQRSLDNSITRIGTYSYDTPIKNTLSYSTGGYFPGDMFGRQTKNVHTSLVLTKADGTVTHNFKRNIEVDYDGYISKVRNTNLLTGVWVEATYTYE